MCGIRIGSVSHHRKLKLYWYSQIYSDITKKICYYILECVSLKYFGKVKTQYDCSYCSSTFWKLTFLDYSIVSSFSSVSAFLPHPLPFLHDDVHICFLNLLFSLSCWRSISILPSISQNELTFFYWLVYSFLCSSLIMGRPTLPPSVPRTITTLYLSSWHVYH